MKVASACRQCRESKRKCTIAASAHQCGPCQHKQLRCSLASNRSRPRAPIRPQRTSWPCQPRGMVYPPRNTVDELVDLYLTLIHDKPHSLFHTPTIRGAVACGSISKQVLCGILALSARFHHDAAVRAQGTAFAQEAKRVLQADVENICVENVQACILVANTCGANNEAASEALFFGIAIRMAQILSLPHASPRDTPIDQEVKRRVYCSLYMVDRWNSAGFGLPRQLPDALPADALPVHERDFHRPHFRYRGHLKRGLWAYFTDLAAVFGEVQDLHRRHVSGALADAHFAAHAQRLAARLERFADALPAELRLSVDALRRHAALGLGRTFVALHLGFHHYATLVHFQHLDMQQQQQQQQQSARRCKHHASAYSDLLRLSTEVPQCEAVYSIVGHMTTVSSSVLLHILFFGDDDELPAARQRLALNFQVLVKLRGYWPSINRMMDRLFTFQKACMWTADPNTHKIDKWMLKFLLQHALPIEDKVATSMPEESASAAAVSEISSERGRYATDALSMLRQ